MEGLDNLRIIRKDGTIQSPYDKLHIPYNKDTKHIYEFIANMKTRNDDNTA